MEDTIRSYGPGKFDTILDSYVYQLSLAGCDDEAGDVAGPGWYGLLRGFEVDGAFSDVSASAELNEAEKDVLRSSAGAIVAEDDLGFVSVEYFETREKLDAAWQAIEQEVSSFYDEEDDSF